MAVGAGTGKDVKRGRGWGQKGVGAAHPPPRTHQQPEGQYQGKRRWTSRVKGTRVRPGAMSATLLPRVHISAGGGGGDAPRQSATHTAS